MGEVGRDVLASVCVMFFDEKLSGEKPVEMRIKKKFKDLFQKNLAAL